MSKPAGTKFHGVAPGVETENKGSSTANANRDVYTIEQIGAVGTSDVYTLLSSTDGSNVDYSIYGQAFLVGSTGSLAVNINGSNIELLATPTTTNSTQWVTQYRYI